MNKPKTLVEVLCPPCPICGLPMRQDERYCSFASGQSPVHTISVKIRLEWCTNDCNNTVATVLPTKTAKNPATGFPR
jgi:hypothetical protein